MIKNEEVNEQWELKTNKRDIFLKMSPFWDHGPGDHGTMDRDHGPGRGRVPALAMVGRVGTGIALGGWGGPPIPSAGGSVSNPQTYIIYVYICIYIYIYVLTFLNICLYIIIIYVRACLGISKLISIVDQHLEALFVLMLNVRNDPHNHPTLPPCTTQLSHPTS